TGATGQSLGPTIGWASSGGATSYEYCVDTTNNTACDTTWTSTTALSATLSGLTANMTYSWQVRARNGAGTTGSDSGTWWSSTTAPTSASGTPVNVADAANGGVATASSFYSPGYAPGGAIDGDRTGRNWGNGGGWNDATPNTWSD